MKIPWSTATNAYQKGESQRHQVNAINKIEYISFVDGDAKLQQDRLVVSVPFCWTARRRRVNGNHAYWSGQGCRTFEVGIKVRVCGCKRARRGKSYSSVRTQQPESEYTQWTSQAYKRKEMDGRKSLLTRAHTGWWRLQENKTKDKYATWLTIYTKR